MSFWMPWRRKKKWSCEEVDFHVLWKAILKMYRKNDGVNGLNAANVGCILDRYWKFPGDNVYKEADSILQIFESMGLVKRNEDVDMSVANGKWVHAYYPVEKANV